MSGRTPEEGRYSKVSRRMWDDERFRRLSAAPPNAQTLWQRLLTGPELGCIPGLYTARLGGLADALGWSIDDVREKWSEIETQGMAVADWRAGLVWVPNAIVHNEPNSVNTILGWRLALRELPECELKRQAIESLREQCAELGESWLAAFDSATNEPKSRPAKEAKPSRRPRRTPSDKASDTASAQPSAMPSPLPSDKASDTQEQDSGAGLRKQEQEISDPPPASSDQELQNKCRLWLRSPATASIEGAAQHSTVRRIAEAWCKPFAVASVRMTDNPAKSSDLAAILQAFAAGYSEQELLRAAELAPGDAFIQEITREGGGGPSVFSLKVIEGILRPGTIRRRRSQAGAESSAEPVDPSVEAKTQERLAREAERQQREIDAQTAAARASLLAQGIDPDAQKPLNLAALTARIG